MVKQFNISRIILVVLVISMMSLFLLSAVNINALAKNQKILFRLDWVPLGYHTPFFVALEKGYWEDKGLDVEIQFGKGSGDTTKMVGVKQAEFGLASSVVSASVIDTGLPIKVVYGLFQKTALGVVVFEDTGMRASRDLIGKKIAVSGEGEDPILVDMWLKANGMTKDDVELVLINSLEARRTMFLEEKVDGVWETIFSSMPIMQEMTDRKMRGILIAEGENPVNLLFQAIITHVDTIDQNPEMVKLFLEGLKQGILYSRDNPEESIDILMKRVPEIQNREIFLGVHLNSFNLMQTNNSKDLPLGAFAEEDWDSTLQIMYDMGKVKEIGEHNKYYTNEFVPVDNLDY
jgi:NitT/TauT family transport system substrate-binding protein